MIFPIPFSIRICYRYWENILILNKFAYPPLKNMYQCSNPFDSEEKYDGYIVWIIYLIKYFIQYNNYYRFVFIFVTVVKITCVGFLAVLGAFLNIVVLVMFYKKPSLRSPSNRSSCLLCTVVVLIKHSQTRLF